MKRDLTVDRYTGEEVKELLGLEYITGKAYVRADKILSRCNFELKQHFYDHPVFLGRNIVAVSPFPASFNEDEARNLLLVYGFKIKRVETILYSTRCGSYLVYPIECSDLVENI